MKTRRSFRTASAALMLCLGAAACSRDPEQAARDHLARFVVAFPLGSVAVMLNVFVPACTGTVPLN